MFILPFLVSIPCDEDLETWREYYEQYFNLVFSFCKIRLNGDEDAAADCAHRVFDIALEKAETLRKHSNIGGWFYKTAKHCILKYCRDENRRYSSVPLSELPNYLKTMSAEDAFIASVNDEDAPVAKEVILARLTESELDAYKLFYIKKYDIAQVAKELHISYNAASVRLHRVKIKLYSAINNIGQYYDDKYEAESKRDKEKK